MPLASLGYQYQRTDFEGGGVTFTVRQQRETLACSQCGWHEVHKRGSATRTYRTVSIGSRPVTIRLHVPRVQCQKCAAVRQVAVPFAEPRKSYTRAFARYVLELSQSMTIRDVANHLGIGWDLVKEIQKASLRTHFAKPKLKHVTQIAIDEISVGRGHRYVTVVLDLQSGAVLYLGQGKGADALQPFWKRLRAAAAQVEAVATDMSPAYISAVLENLPEAALVFDRFHVMKLYNEKLSDLRRDLYREAVEGLGKDVRKGTRWLLLKNMENLDDSRDERRRLQEALDLNQSLATAYYMKELLRLFWDQPDKASAETWLDDWCRSAEASGIRMRIRFAKTLRGHRSGLLAWYDRPLSTGPLEGTNNKIKTLQRQAYGYRDREFFELKIFAIHLARYQLIG